MTEKELREHLFIARDYVLLLESFVDTDEINTDEKARKYTELSHAFWSKEAKQEADKRFFNGLNSDN